MLCVFVALSIFSFSSACQKLSTAPITPHGEVQLCLVKCPDLFWALMVAIYPFGTEWCCGVSCVEHIFSIQLVDSCPPYILCPVAQCDSDQSADAQMCFGRSGLQFGCTAQNGAAVNFVLGYFLFSSGLLTILFSRTCAARTATDHKSFLPAGVYRLQFGLAN